MFVDMCFHNYVSEYVCYTDACDVSLRVRMHSKLRRGCTCPFIFACAYIYIIYKSMYICVYIYVCIYMYRYYMSVYRRMHACRYVYIHLYVYVCMCV